MKVLVIGGSGFIGSHVVDKLLGDGHSVRVFDRLPERFRAPLPSVDYRFGDFADAMALLEALTGVDTVFHLLSTTLPGTADLDPKTDVRDNLIGSINLLNSMHSLGLGGFCSCRQAGLSTGFRRPFQFRRRTLCVRSVHMALSRLRSNTILKCTAGREASRQLSCALQIHLDRGSRIPASRARSRHFCAGYWRENA